MATPLPIEQASIGMADSLILMILALVVFGPRKLPQIGRQIGRLMYEFRKASNDFKFQMEEELRLAEDAERRQKEEAERQRLLTDQAAVHAQPALAAGAEPLLDPTVQAPAVSDSVVQEHNPYTSADLTAQSIPEQHYPRVAEPVPAGPVIQPPSTGETVAASAPTAFAAEAAAAEPAAVAEEAPQSPSTETVSQHG